MLALQVVRQLFQYGPQFLAHTGFTRQVVNKVQRPLDLLRRAGETAARTGRSARPAPAPDGFLSHSSTSTDTLARNTHGSIGLVR